MGIQVINTRMNFQENTLYTLFTCVFLLPVWLLSRSVAILAISFYPEIATDREITTKTNTKTSSNKGFSYTLHLDMIGSNCRTKTNNETAVESQITRELGQLELE